MIEIQDVTENNFVKTFNTLIDVEMEQLTTVYNDII